MRQHHSALIAALLVAFTSACGEDDDHEPRGEGNATFAAPIGGGGEGNGATPAPSEGSAPDQGGIAGPSSPSGPESGGPDGGGDEPNTPEDPSTVPPPAQPDPGPPPTSTCTVQKDDSGFFWRTSSKSKYVAYVPASYDPTKPMRLIVGMHGCGDDALNFAQWGVNPYATRATQDHIGISVSGETGNNKCWSMGGDDEKVLAAVEDLATCFWVNRSKVVIAGFSSGGQLAYRVGMMHASSFAGILIENSGLYAAGATPATLIAGAAWKLPVAHRAHTGDTVFPIDKVRADWVAMDAAGFSVTTSEVAGGHDGTSDDWAKWLIPQSTAWVHP
jgi:predicted esterase